MRDEDSAQLAGPAVQRRDKRIVPPAAGQLALIVLVAAQVWLNSSSVRTRSSASFTTACSPKKAARSAVVLGRFSGSTNQ